MRILRWLILLGLVFALPPSSQRLEARQIITKGQMVGVKIPRALWKVDGISVMTSVDIYAVEIRESGATTVTVGNDGAWQVAGFPSLEKFKVEKISQKKDFTEVELRSKFEWLKLRFMDPVADVNRALSAVTTSDPTVYLDEAYSLMAKKFFDGPLVVLSQDQQRSLVRYAHIDAKGSTIRNQTYKDNLYMVVDLGRDTTVYNDLKFTQASLIAYVLNEELLKTLKGFAVPVKGVSGIFGLKLEIEIPHESFLDKKAVTPTYKLQLFAPVEQIRKFADADITNQQFVDNCVVIVDDNRIQVSLTGGGL